MGLVIQRVKPNHFSKKLLKYIFMKSIIQRVRSNHFSKKLLKYIFMKLDFRNI